MKIPALVQPMETRILLNSGPILDAVSDLQVPQGKSIFVPLTASDDDGDVLQWTLTSTDSDVVEVTRHDDDPWLELTVSYGDTTGTMVFLLFKDLAPVTVNAFVGLVNARYYDGLSIDSISSGQWLTGGASDSSPFVLDDEYNAAAIFNGYGQLGLNSAEKDQNTPEFFITGDVQRTLDFNKTLFGQLVRGDDVLEDLLALDVDGGGAPVDPVTIVSARMVQNTSDVVISLTGIGAGTATIQLSVSDGTSTDTVSFDGTVFHDATNDHPFLGDLQPVIIDPQQLAGLGTVTENEVDYVVLPPITLSGTDLEKNAIHYAATLLPVDGFTHGACSTTGNQVTVKVLSGYTGKLRLFVTCFGGDVTQFDPQEIPIAVGAYAISGSADNRDCVRNFTCPSPIGGFTTDDGTAAASDFTATVQWGDGFIEEAEVAGGQGVFTINASHMYEDNGDYPLTCVIENSFGAVAVVRSTYRVNDHGVGADLARPDQRSFFLNGTEGDDVIRVKHVARGFRVFLNDESIGTYNIDGKIYILGHSGNDQILADRKLPWVCAFDGGDDADYLEGGEKSDMLFGGWGRDTLIGNNGNDVLIGGDGIDLLYGNAGKDALIGGWTDYDEQLSDQMILFSNWTSQARTYAEKSAAFIGDVKLIHNDYCRDLLEGGADMDLFVTKPLKSWGDRVRDKHPKEYTL